MEYPFSDNLPMVYEAICKVEQAIVTLQERVVQVHSANDFLLSPWGMEKLDAACMVLIAIGKTIKTIDKLTGRQLLVNYPSVEWKKVMGTRDVIAHHYFDVDADEVFEILKSDLEPLRIAILQIKQDLFGADA